MINNLLDEEIIKEFNKINVFEEDEMLMILDGLNEIAEIGYSIYINKHVKGRMSDGTK